MLWNRYCEFGIKVQHFGLRVRGSESRILDSVLRVYRKVFRAGHIPEAGEGASAVDLVEVVHPPNLEP